MKTRAILSRFLSLLSLTGALSLRAELLDGAGHAFREIVVAENAPATVRLAAEELRSFLARRCGAQLNVTAKPSHSPCILVGDSPALSQNGLSPATLPEEGYAIKSGDGYLALYGRDYDGPPVLGNINPWRGVEAYNRELELCAFGEAGTLSAVHEFLQQICGIRFYMPGELGTFVPPVGDVRVPALNMVAAPRTHYRYPWFSMFEYSPESALWARRVGFGGKAPVMIIHSYGRFSRFQGSHPEYFALADGKRAFGGECVANGKGHLCLSNPEVIRQWAEDIIAFFRSNPEFDVYPLAPEDGLTRICGCPSCASELRPDMPEEGRFSYHIWHFTCQVAAQVAKVFPDKFVGCLAYEKYRMPPEELDSMPNVAVMFCNRRSALANPQTAATLHAEIESWSRKASRIYLWNWYLEHWLPWTGLPAIFDDTIERELKWLFANPKYQGEFIEAESQGGNAPGLQKYATMCTPSLQHWNLYVTARLHQRPDLDVQREYEEFCGNFYGPAAHSMRRFWDTCRDTRNRAFAHAPSPSPDMVYTPEILKTLQGILAEAEREAGESPLHLARLRMLAEEFGQGAKRLARLAHTNGRTIRLPRLDKGFDSLQDVSPEQFLGKDGSTVEPPTWLYAGYDRQFLYFRFLCYEPRMEALVAEVKAAGQGEIWMDDSIELFICPNESRRSDCFQLIINTLGVVDAGHYLATERRRDPLWNSRAEANVRKEANRWLLDVRLPFSAIGINDPNFIGNLAGNFYRNRQGLSTLQSTCWCPTGENAHFAPAKFGVFTLQK